MEEGEGGSSLFGEESGKKSVGWTGETGEGDATQTGLIGDGDSEGEAGAAGAGEMLRGGQMGGLQVKVVGSSGVVVSAGDLRTSAHGAG